MSGSKQGRSQMIHKEKCIVLDVDGTICPIKGDHEQYADLKPFPDMLEKIRAYKDEGFYIILYTSRNMNSYEGNIGLINANTAATMLAWLKRHNIPYDEIHYGKPWPGKDGIYVDDRAVRPDEFLSLSHADLRKKVSP